MIIDYLNKLFPNPSCELIYNNDYELLISVMLSAQTTDKKVNEVTKILFKKYNSIEKLKDAEYNDIVNIIKPLGNYNKKADYILKIAQMIYNKPICNDRNYLESMPGVGRKTTNVVLSILYNEPCIAVDTHVYRVCKRLGITNYQDNYITTEQKLYKYFKGEDFSKLHHQLLLFGRYYCKSKKPQCKQCGLKNICKKGY